MWQADDPSVADDHEVVRARLAELLSEYEVGLLARHAFDGQTQTEIAAADGVAQTTISHRVRKTVARLKAAGIDVPVPGRSPTSRPAGRLVYVEPAALDRLVREDPPAGEGRQPTRGKWPAGDKLGDPPDGPPRPPGKRRR